MLSEGRRFMYDRRKQLGLTMKEVATAIGVKEATYLRYENGVVKNIPYDRIIAISEILKCNPEDLLRISKNPSSNNNENNIELDSTEQKLIESFRSLNEEGREKLIGYVDDLLVTGKYKKSAPNGLGQKEA